MDRRKQYRPAPADAAALQNYYQRVSLSQGRLSSAPLLPQHLITSPRSETKRRELQESLKDYELPQHVVDAIAKEERDRTASLTVAEQADVMRHPTVGPHPSSSPRRDQPQLYQGSTHSTVISTEDLLALSDNEDIRQHRDKEQRGGHGGTASTTVHVADMGPKVTRHIIGSAAQRQQQAVILVDATSPREPTQSEELPVTTSIYTSPVRVIRHSSRRTETTQQSAAQGTVNDDVLVTLSDFEESNSLLDGQHQAKRVPRIARSLDMSRRHRGDVMDDLGVTALNLEPTVDEELYRKMEMSVREEVVQKQRRETGELDGGIRVRGHGKMTDRKKKSKGRIVSSRYRAKARGTKRSPDEHKTAVAAQVKALRTSKLDVSRQRRSDEARSHNRSYISYHSGSATPFFPAQSANRSVWQSTPFAPDDVVAERRRLPVAGPDVSYISRDGLDASLRDGHDGASLYRMETSQATASHAGAGAKSRDARSRSGKLGSSSQITQKELDLLTCRMHEWSFLAAMADKALHEQEQEAMKQLYAIWSETEKLRQQHHKLTVGLQEGKHSEELDHTLDLQLKGLGPIVNLMVRLEPQYSQLARALDTTRHQLPTQGIKLPENSEMLTRAIGRSEKILGEILAEVRQQQPKAAALSQTMQALEGAFQAEELELQRCIELLSACESLGTQETSMRIHQMQTGNTGESVS